MGRAREAKVVQGSDFKVGYGARGTEEAWRMNTKLEQLANSTHPTPAPPLGPHKCRA